MFKETLKPEASPSSQTPFWNMEATGYSRWFERLVAELGFELWIGDPAQIKAKRVKKQKYDREDGVAWKASHCQDDAELCLAAQHACVSLCRLFERIGFNHGTHSG